MVSAAPPTCPLCLWPASLASPAHRLAPHNTPQDKAEEYCEGLRGGGLISTIEPAGGSGGNSGPDDSP